MAEREYTEVGDGVYLGKTGPIEEGDIAPPNSKSRRWVTQKGLEDAGGQFKDGKKVPPTETDI